jgi:hypothetical protein
MIRFVGGPEDGQARDIHKNTEELTLDQGQVRYVRKLLDTGEEVFMFDATHQRRLEQERSRSMGQALDQRFEELTRDAPKPPRSNQDRRRRR